VLQLHLDRLAARGGGLQVRANQGVVRGHDIAWQPLPGGRSGEGKQGGEGEHDFPHSTNYQNFPDETAGFRNGAQPCCLGGFDAHFCRRRHILCRAAMQEALDYVVMESDLESGYSSSH
jgi:hypothetical protein